LLCGELGSRPSHVALAWLLGPTRATSVVVGPRTVEQLLDLVPAVDVTLTEDVYMTLDRIFPGPGGSAPEAYAW